MLKETTAIDQTTSFVCPQCSASAFEVMDTQWQEGELFGAARPNLILQCLKCLHTFSHHVSDPSCLASPLA